MVDSARASLPKAAVGVPRITQLRASLKYPEERRPLAAKFWRIVAVFRDQYHTAAGTPGTSLHTWKSRDHIKDLTAMAREFLGHNGDFWWPSDPSSPRYTESLQYSKDARFIRMTLIQLFFRLNLQEYQTKRYKLTKQGNAADEEPSGSSTAAANMIDLEAPEPSASRRSSTVRQQSVPSGFTGPSSQGANPSPTVQPPVRSDIPPSGTIEDSQESRDMYSVPQSPRIPQVEGQSSARPNIPTQSSTLGKRGADDTSGANKRQKSGKLVQRKRRGVQTRGMRQSPRQPKTNRPSYWASQEHYDRHTMSNPASPESAHSENAGTPVTPSNEERRDQTDEPVVRAEALQTSQTSRATADDEAGSNQTAFLMQESSQMMNEFLEATATNNADDAPPYPAPQSSMSTSSAASFARMVPTVFGEEDGDMTRVPGPNFRNWPMPPLYQGPDGLPSDEDFARDIRSKTVPPPPKPRRMVTVPIPRPFRAPVAPMSAEPAPVGEQELAEAATGVHERDTAGARTIPARNSERSRSESAVPSNHEDQPPSEGVGSAQHDTAPADDASVQLSSATERTEAHDLHPKPNNASRAGSSSGTSSHNNATNTGINLSFLVTVAWPSLRVTPWAPKGKFLKKTLSELRDELPRGVVNQQQEQSLGFHFKLRGPDAAVEYKVYHGDDAAFDAVKRRMRKEIRKGSARHAAAAGDGEGGGASFRIEIEELRADLVVDEDEDEEDEELF